ncbi:hypothetical protein [Pedobacter sp. GR22-6]|uniref:hypothetical protein n=1 Tax=Pedobacter sp. GR22-6 TaxID=3127957 RepID=UPI00307F5B62
MKKLSIIRHGKKLKGKFTLVKTYGKAENGWLLIRAKDFHNRSTTPQSIQNLYGLLLLLR